ncbi:CD225/dispanin family protein [Nocardiopsis sediminis]|uniref:CD225/dispanin family protein n=1 Tax=Nocardiopsis sediminis TaxID=1778267 RepID=A0ABV8FR63_9ACTN
MSYGPPPGPPGPPQPPYGGGGYGPPPPGGPGGFGGPPPGGGGTPPNNWLVASIIAIFCCWPLAIPAIIFATKVNTQWNVGDYAGAEDAAGKAKMFSIIAFVLGGLWVIGWIIYYFVVLAALGAASTTY